MMLYHCHLRIVRQRAPTIQEPVQTEHRGFMFRLAVAVVFNIDFFYGIIIISNIQNKVISNNMVRQLGSLLKNNGEQLTKKLIIISSI